MILQRMLNTVRHSTTRCETLGIRHVKPPSSKSRHELIV